MSMRKQIIFCLVFFATCSVNARTKTVAVIDTGLKQELIDGGRKNGICKFGHRDFTGEGLNDVHGHGTNISGLIQRGANGSNYCQVILKYYKPEHDMSGKIQAERFVKAIRYAISIKVDYINISGGGRAPIEEERVLINEALEKGIKIIAAAGNEHSDIDTHPYYPAFYNKEIYVVGNGTDRWHHALTSNYGDRVNVWRDGDHQFANGIIQTGTSQATAIYTGELIKADCASKHEPRKK